MASYPTPLLCDSDGEYAACENCYLCRDGIPCEQPIKREVVGQKTLRTSNESVTDDLKDTILAEINDKINEAWKGWDMAVKFEDEKLQDYYMKFVTVLGETVKKIRKI